MRSQKDNKNFNPRVNEADSEFFYCDVLDLVYFWNNAEQLNRVAVRTIFHYVYNIMSSVNIIIFSPINFSHFIEWRKIKHQLQLL